MVCPVELQEGEEEVKEEEEEVEEDKRGGRGQKKKVHKAGREEVKGKKKKKKKREWDESCNLLCRSIYISFQSMRVLYMQSEHSAFNLFTM